MVMTKQLTPLAEKMLEFIAESGGWMSRKQLADRMSRKQLSAHDISTLNLLVGMGELETEKHDIGLVKFEFRYRIPKRD